MPAPSLDSIVSLCKRRGFIFPGSDIYGGLANTWDYGPLGVELKNRVKQHWWNTFVHRRTDIVGLDSAILMNPKVWEASGHVETFSDPLVEDVKTNKRYRADHLLEEQGIKASNLDADAMWKLIQENKIKSPDNNELTPPKEFNLMFKTHQGVVEETSAMVYLRPETAQGIFVNFANILQTMRPRLPFGVAQIGKAFRNEITPGNFTFRTREFEQMEIEYFVKPDGAKDAFDAWQKDVWNWFTVLGIDKKNLRVREHDPDELSHYSAGTIDIEYKFPWGWGELFGLANRTDYDLKQHEKFSGEKLLYTDPHDPKDKFTPYVIEPSFGCDRSVLTFLIEAYTEEELDNGDTRIVMKFDKHLSPVDIAVLPLSKKEPLLEKANEVRDLLMNETNLVIDFDVTGSIGKRYRRQDEIGTPLAITVDFGTIGDDKEQGEEDTVTIRDRDTLVQERIHISELREKIAEYWKK
ncbi:glycine--tRNA ligase [Candidatus Peregrinibacteria bacterium]|nr:glycine--tRNA ligase [Candidatus Peregrinibacteria bacterium]MBT3598669.1 glycine--tRNA ligase [Candidatus Peregrinibacteria bacterium]MBT4585334.1 glycine--tRNA ligase [Candidatus Peregrinibacteria bacterium]MBT6730841.1 glycine--tRNA ligase [Candidatus Peregrinibacteria bacterium]MBT7008934.1 glycine--tRNA ligase [Candidatus Peregrinibacteria bacterium]